MAVRWKAALDGVPARRPGMGRCGEDKAATVGPARRDPGLRGRGRMCRRRVERGGPGPTHPPETRTRARPSLPLAFAALFAAAPPAQAQSTTFVSNIGQDNRSGNNNVTVNTHRAQQFETGDHPGGYTLSEVVVNIRSFTHVDADAFALYTSTTSNRPGTKIADLSGTLGTGRTSFTPGSNRHARRIDRVLHRFFGANGDRKPAIDELGRRRRQRGERVGHRRKFSVVDQCGLELDQYLRINRNRRQGRLHRGRRRDLVGGTDRGDEHCIQWPRLLPGYVWHRLTIAARQPVGFGFRVPQRLDLQHRFDPGRI